MVVRRIISDYVLAHPEEFSSEDYQTQDEQSNDDNTEFNEYVLNALKNLKSKMKTLSIIIRNLNNYGSYSILSSKSETVKLCFGFMDIEDYKGLFK
jgi:hypothetical protein